MWRGRLGDLTLTDERSGEVQNGGFYNAEVTPRRYISCLLRGEQQKGGRALAPALSGAHTAERAGRAEDLLRRWFWSV